jgi:hypothetical protein
MKDTLRLLLFHLRRLPHAVTIAYPFGSSRGLRTCIKPRKQEPRLELPAAGGAGLHATDMFIARQSPP